MQKKDRDFVGAIEKGLAVIEAFDASSQRMTLSDVARKTGLTRPTARRYLLSLARLKYAETDGKHFWLTHRVLRIGFAYLSSAPLPRIVQPVLDQLAETTREAASIATLDGAEIVFLASAVAPRIMAATINAGLRLPAFGTASGRVLLAGLPEEEVARRLKSTPPKKLTARSKTGRRELLEEIRDVRQKGYAINDEEQEIGIRSIAVPVAVPRVPMGLAMSVSIHAGRISVAEMIREILPRLRAGKLALEKGL